MDIAGTVGTLLCIPSANEVVSRVLVKELLLTAVFAIHAAAFAFLYLRRGRRGFHLLFVGGFLLLAAFYANNGPVAFVGAGSVPEYLSALRWAGVILCGLATPPLLIDWYRRRRGDPARL
jgi:hypothetical protein